MVFFCFKQNTAYVLRISDWSSDVCSSDLAAASDSWRRRSGVKATIAFSTSSSAVSTAARKARYDWSRCASATSTAAASWPALKIGRLSVGPKTQLIEVLSARSPTLAAEVDKIGRAHV